MSLGLIALIISLVALAINVVNHLQIRWLVHTSNVAFSIVYDEIRGGNRGMIKEEETYE